MIPNVTLMIDKILAGHSLQQDLVVNEHCLV